MAGADTLVRDSPPAAGAERLIHLFVHDLRAPLGVATGYLRLLQDGRLGTDIDQRVALTRTLDALGRIATLCDAMADVGTRPEPGEEPGRLLPEDLVARVGAAVKPPVRIEPAEGWPAGFTVAVGRDGDRFARAVALVLSAAARRGTSAIVAAAAREDVLRFTLNPHPDAAGSSGGAFDPWRGFGLEVVLACQAIDTTGGRVRAGGDVDLAIELPLVRQDAR
jgi:signal transduction histidine kinase